MNPERFEERLVHELKNHIQQRVQQTSAEEMVGVRPVRRRRVRWLPIAVAAGLTAVVAATTLALGQSGANTGGGQAKAPGTSQPLGRITKAAYTLEQQASGKVKLTVGDPFGKPGLRDLTRMVEGMRWDLARMGVQAKVLLGDPECSSVHATTKIRLKKIRSTLENGKSIVYLDPSIVPTGDTLIIGFPAAHTERPLGVMTIADATGDGPDCIAAEPGDVLQPDHQR
ncbi:hypothetical protein [Peterkaempfera sp. SMS 1(5)a]|uniref:hypothetical protein n=1 Tax=Peterkaempfera podocarpi TaxID=3232308 RepID=UPI00366DD355